MSWLRLDSDFASDGTLRRCKAVIWWPLILCAIKRGGGHASADDISGEVLADIGQGDEGAANRAIDRLKAAGMLVETEHGWTTPGWTEMQPDPTGSDRAKRYRERNRLAAEEASRRVTVTQRDETVRHSDVTVENAPSRLTGQDRTGHTGQDHVTGAGDTTPRARAHEVDPVSAPAPDGLGQVVEAFRATLTGRGALFAPPATVHTLQEWTTAHGAPVVIEAIARGHEAARGGLTLAYLRPIVEAVARGEPRGRPMEKQPMVTGDGRRTDRRTEDFGPRPLAPGEL